MHRRDYLASISAIGGALVAGCSGDSSTPTPTPTPTPGTEPVETPRGPEPPTESDSPSQTEMASETPTTPAIDESSVSLTSSSMDVQAEDGHLVVNGTVRNDNSREVEAALGATIYDANDDILGGIQSEFSVIEGGTTREFAVQGDQHADEADDYAVRVLVH